MNARTVLLITLLCINAAGARASEATFLHLAQLAQVRDARLAAEEHTLQARRENVRIGESLFYPRVEFSSQILSSRQNRDNTGSTHSDELEHALRASMDVLNRKNLYDARASNSELQAQEHRRDEVAQQVLLDAITALLEMHAASDTRQLLKKRLNGTVQRLELARAREAQGVAPRLETTLAEAEMQTAKGELALGEARVRKAQQALFNLTGVAVTALPQLSAHFRLPPLPPAEEVEREVMRNNPELKSSLKTLQAYRHRTSAAAAGHSPVFTLSSEYRTSGSGTDTAGLALQVRVPLYSGGAIDAGSALAVAQQLAYAASIRDYRRRLRQNVFDLYQDARAIARREGALQAQIAARTDLLEKTRLAWLEGLRSAQDVVDVEQALFANERDLRNLYFQYLGILSQMQRLGGGISVAFLAQLDGYFQ